MTAPPRRRREPRGRSLRVRIAQVWFTLHTLALVTLLHIPLPPLPPVTDNPDWIAHGLAFGGFTLLLGLTGLCGRAGSPLALARVLLIAAPAAAVLEASQSLPGINRHSTPGDLLANAVGVAAGMLALGVIGFTARRTHAGDDAGPRGADAGERDDSSSAGFVAHARTFAGVTLLSRVFGLVRDALCAAAFGASPTWSAFVSAFVVPNVFRRLFGEGALSAAFLPEYTRLTAEDPAAARRFATLTVLLVGGVLSVIAGGIAAAILLSLPDGVALSGVGPLAVIMLPFAPLVCVTAILGAMLQAHGRFVPTAAAPILLNTCMIVAVGAGGAIFGVPLSELVVWLAVSVAAAGLVQTLWCWAELGAVTGPDFRAAGELRRVVRMLRRMVPVLVGLGAAQIGVLADTLIAGWPVIVGPTAFGVDYPLDGGSAATIYFGQRLYQLPLGVFVIALATAIFPALARLHADHEGFRVTVHRGLRLGAFIAVPAAVGLAATGDAMVGAIYGGTGVDPGDPGATGFTQADAERVTLVLLAYTPAIVFAGASHVLTRAFYAVDKTTPPMIAGLVGLTVNLLLSVALMFPLREAGLALSSSVGGLVQLTVLAVGAKRSLPAMRTGAVFTFAVEKSILLTIAAAGAMGAGVYLAVDPIRAAALDAGLGGRWMHLAALAVVVPGAMVVYTLLNLRREELRWLRSRSLPETG